MRKALALFLAVFAVAGTAVAGYAAEYDRYERGYREPPPPVRRAAEPPPVRHAQHGEPYIYGQVGIYEPNDELDGLWGYDSGGNFAVAIGSRVSPVFAVEGTLGGFAAERGDDEVAVVPLTIGGRFIVPNPFVEPYIGGGLGLYFASLDEPSSGINDDSTDFGGYLSLGIDFWLNPRVALNFEARHHWIDTSFDSFDVDLSGWTANFGVRVSF